MNTCLDHAAAKLHYLQHVLCEVSSTLFDPRRPIRLLHNVLECSQYDLSRLLLHRFVVLSRYSLYPSVYTTRKQ